MQTTLKREDRWSQALNFLHQLPVNSVELKFLARKFFRKKRTLGFNYKAFALCLRNKFDALRCGPTISGRSFNYQFGPIENNQKLFKTSFISASEGRDGENAYD